MNFKNPKITVDGIIINNNEILLVKRKNKPFEGMWALPGGFVNYEEKTEEAVKREILEETGLQTKVYGLVGVYSDPNRDPRGHTITIVYKLDILNGKLRAGDDASDAKFLNINKLPDLAFDHKKIINNYLLRFKK